MRPIPKKLLIHSATLSETTENAWQEQTATTVAELARIRIEPCAKRITTKDNRQITLCATLFFCCRNSSPRDVAFEVGQRITFGDSEFTVETVEPLYDEKKLHHYELGLI